MMNTEEDNPSWSSFLIDLDLAIREDRESPSDALSKTGIRAFMAIGSLIGENIPSCMIQSRSFGSFLDLHSLQRA